MAEEHRCETPEGHRLCANNCGFFGSSATMNFCSKCYRDIHLKEQEQAKTKSTIETALSSASSSSVATAAVVVESPVLVPSIESLPLPQPQPPVRLVVSDAPESSIGSVQPNRCGTCRKRTGLTGFKCRCGITFCGTHRYPEKHECGYDFKAVGREEIAKANPVIKADKLRRIWFDFRRLMKDLISMIWSGTFVWCGTLTYTNESCGDAWWNDVKNLSIKKRLNKSFFSYVAFALCIKWKKKSDFLMLNEMKLKI